MPETKPVYIATIGIGYGKRHYAEILDYTFEHSGVKSQIVDLLPMMGKGESAVLRAGYHTLSQVPIASRWTRRTYGARGVKSADVGALEQAFPKHADIVTVSAVAMGMLAPLKNRQIHHLIADRRVEPEDVAPHANRIMAPDCDVENAMILPSTKTMYTGGFPLPKQYMYQSTLDAQRRRLLGKDGPRHVMYAASGAGLGAGFDDAMDALAPYVQGRNIALTIFAGHRPSDAIRARRALTDRGLVEYQPNLKDLGGVRVTGGTGNITEAVRERLNTLPESEFIVQAAPNELTHGPWISIFDSKVARNDREIANAQQAVKRGNGIDARGNWQRALSILFDDHDRETPLKMLETAWSKNNPRLPVARRIVETVTGWAL